MNDRIAVFDSSGEAYKRSFQDHVFHAGLCCEVKDVLA
jgi:hypothetical protein